MFIKNYLFYNVVSDEGEIKTETSRYGIIIFIKLMKDLTPKKIKLNNINVRSENFQQNII